MILLLPTLSWNDNLGLVFFYWLLETTIVIPLVRTIHDLAFF